MKQKIIFTTQDPQNRNVTLHANTLQHIIKRHPEVRGVQEIQTTIQNPDFITENTSETQIVYTKISSLVLYVNIYAVTNDIDNSAVVKTAFLQSRPPKGNVIWQKRARI